MKNKVNNDTCEYYFRELEEIKEKCTFFINKMNDEINERIITPRISLRFSQYLAFEKNKKVLFVLSDLNSLTDSIRSIYCIQKMKSEDIFRNEFSSLFEMGGSIKEKEGSVTIISISLLPNDDMNHPIPDMSGYLSESIIYIDRRLSQIQIFPPIDISYCYSFLFHKFVGENKTRKEHFHLSNQIVNLYSTSKQTLMNSFITGTTEDDDLLFLNFRENFENSFIHQNTDFRTIEESLDILWKLISIFPKNNITLIPPKILEQFYSYKLK